MTNDDGKELSYQPKIHLFNLKGKGLFKQPLHHVEDNKNPHPDDVSLFDSVSSTNSSLLSDIDIVNYASERNEALQLLQLRSQGLSFSQWELNEQQHQRSKAHYDSLLISQLQVHSEQVSCISHSEGGGKAIIPEDVKELKNKNRIDENKILNIDDSNDNNNNNNNNNNFILQKETGTQCSPPAKKKEESPKKLIINVQTVDEKPTKEKMCTKYQLKKPSVMDAKKRLEQDEEKKEKIKKDILLENSDELDEIKPMYLQGKLHVEIMQEETKENNNNKNDLNVARKSEHQVSNASEIWALVDDADNGPTVFIKLGSSKNEMNSKSYRKYHHVCDLNPEDFMLNENDHPSPIKSNNEANHQSILTFPVPLENSYHLVNTSMKQYKEEREKEKLLQEKLKGVGCGVQSFKEVIEEMEKVADEIENDYMQINKDLQVAHEKASSEFNQTVSEINSKYHGAIVTAESVRNYTTDGNNTESPSKSDKPSLNKRKQLLTIPDKISPNRNLKHEQHEESLSPKSQKELKEAHDLFNEIERELAFVTNGELLPRSQLQPQYSSNHIPLPLRVQQQRLQQQQRVNNNYNNDHSTTNNMYNRQQEPASSSPSKTNYRPTLPPRSRKGRWK